jgi:hypothetical protein
MGCFVLQNKNKQTVRTFNWEATTLNLVYRDDLGRVEAVGSLKDLEDQNINHTVLLTTTQSEVRKKDISIAGYGFISYKDEHTEIAPSFEIVKEESEIKTSLKYSAIFHISVLGLLMIISFIANRYFDEKPKLNVVTINIAPPVEALPEPPKKKVETVKVAEHKIKPVVKKRHEKLSHVRKVVKRAPKKVTVVKKLKIRKNIPATVKAPDINQMGALSALKSVNKKASAMSLNLNGIGKGEGGAGSGGRGYGGNGRGGGGLGEGLKGGASGALAGRGLIASSPGTGSQASGAGGYGSSGAGGGRAAQGGAISFRGRSGAFMMPMTEEATVESGLDRDQINAVVQKNMGQIIYCYEMGLQGKPNLKGRLTANWVISGRGRVNTSQIAHSSVGDSKVERCITGKIKNWKFPKPVGGVNVDVSYPFELRRVSQR